MNESNDNTMTNARESSFTLFKRAYGSAVKAQDKMQMHLLSMILRFLDDRQDPDMVKLSEWLTEKHEACHMANAIRSWLKQVCQFRVTGGRNGKPIAIRLNQRFDYNAEWLNGPDGPKQIPWYDHARAIQELKAPALPLASVETQVARMVAMAAPDTVAELLDQLKAELDQAVSKGRARANDDKIVDWTERYAAQQQAKSAA